MEKPYHIEVDSKVTPVVNPPRTIPAALRERVKTELEDMEKGGVIRKVEERPDLTKSKQMKEESTVEINLRSGSILVSRGTYRGVGETKNSA